MLSVSICFRHQILLLSFACRRQKNVLVLCSGKRAFSEVLLRPSTSSVSSHQTVDDFELINRLNRNVSLVNSIKLEDGQWQLHLSLLKKTAWRWNTAFVTLAALKAVNQRNQTLLSKQFNALRSADFAAMLLFYKRWQEEMTGRDYPRKGLIQWMEVNVPKLSREEFFMIVRAYGFHGNVNPALAETIKTRFKELLFESSAFDLLRFLIAMKVMKVAVEEPLLRSIIDRVNSWKWDVETTPVSELSDCLRLFLKRFDRGRDLTASFAVPDELNAWLKSTMQLPFEIPAYSAARSVAFTSALIHSEQADNQLFTDDEINRHFRQIVRDLERDWPSNLLVESNRRNFLVFLIGIATIGDARCKDPLKYFDVDVSLDAEFWKKFWMQLDDVMERLPTTVGLQLLRRIVNHTASHNYELVSSTKALPSSSHGWVEPFFQRIQQLPNFPLTIFVLCCPSTAPKSVIRKLSYHWRDMDWSKYEDEHLFPKDRQKFQVYQMAETHLNKLRETASW